MGPKAQLPRAFVEHLRSAAQQDPAAGPQELEGGPHQGSPSALATSIMSFPFVEVSRTCWCRRRARDEGSETAGCHPQVRRANPELLLHEQKRKARVV